MATPLTIVNLLPRVGGASHGTDKCARGAERGTLRTHHVVGVGAFRRTRSQRAKWGPTIAWTVLVVIAGMAAVRIDPTASQPGLAPPPPAIVGVFTGEYVDAIPVYRLPPIEVVGARDADIVRD